MTTTTDPMIINRLGALALRVSDAVTTATRSVAAGASTHPEALTALLNFADGERIESLRDALGLSQPGTAHLVSRLEGAGLARRRSDPADRRGTLVVLTPKGRRLARRIAAVRERAIVDALGPLTRADEARLGAVLDHVLAGGTTSRRQARRTCRACDVDACDHPGSCPVTRGADRVEPS